MRRDLTERWSGEKFARKIARRWCGRECGAPGRGQDLRGEKDELSKEVVS